MSCPACFSGGVHEGTPVGEETTMHGRQVYIARPLDGAQPKGIVIFITDAFGWQFVNNKLLCDTYAHKGQFMVIMPDFMDGWAIDPKLLPIMKRITDPGSILYKIPDILSAASYVLPWMFMIVAIGNVRITEFVQDIRTSEPPFPTKDLKIGAAGFCWGGRYSIQLAKDEPSTRVVRHSSQINSTDPLPLIDCSFAAHPSMLKMPKDFEEVKLPLSMAVGHEDAQMTAEQVKEMNEILMVKKRGDHEVNLLEGAKHGFSVRATTEDDQGLQNKCADEAEKQAIDWFTKHFT